MRAHARARVCRFNISGRNKGLGGTDSKWTQEWGKGKRGREKTGRRREMEEGVDCVEKNDIHRSWAVPNTILMMQVGLCRKKNTWH